MERINGKNVLSEFHVSKSRDLGWASESVKSIGAFNFIQINFKLK